ncbi:MAG TPA: rod shape-determining protein MreC [Opitutaceae bacterium]|nr:rod shape-determining protein MreC [Opitutaceae bacterium]
MRIGRSQRFDQARPFVTLGLAFAVWLVAPVALRTFSRASFFEMTAPVAATASYVGDLQRFWALRLHSKEELIEAGRDMARIDASYAISVQRSGALEAEVARLQALLHMPASEHFRFEHARVAQRDFSGWWQRMVIRKGADFGIPVGAPVVFSGGLVGRVSEVHAYTSVVELVSDPGLRIAAVVEGDTRPISYQGAENQVFGPARGVIEFVPLDVYANASAPKLLSTSGLGGVYPAGLTIGRIVHVESSEDGLFKTGEVELDPRLAELTEVTVLVPSNPG